MRTKQILGIAVSLTALVLLGCSKDDKGDEFTSLTVEQSKQKIEDAGIQLMNNVNDLQNVEAVFVIQDINNLDLSGVPNMSSAMRSAVAAIDPSVNAKALATRGVTVEPETLSQLFNQEKGIYTYNSAEKKWDVTASSTQIKYIFPTRNNAIATLVVDNFTYAANPHPDGSPYELIGSLNIKLTKADVSLVSFTFTGTYDADGVPTQINENLLFGNGFGLKTTLANNHSQMTFEHSFTKGSEELYKFHFESAGTYTYNQLSNLDINGDESQIFNILMKSANAYFVIANLKFEGVFQAQKMNDEMTAAFPNGISDENKADVQKQVDLMNNNIAFFVRFNDNNDIIAKSEFYTREENWYNQTYYNPEMRMKFGDGSYVSDNTFSGGFEDLFTKIGTFIDGANTNYNQE